MINHKEDNEMTVKEIVEQILSGVTLVAIVGLMLWCILMIET